MRKLDLDKCAPWLTPDYNYSSPH